jgi:hypothetical protein
MPTETELRGDYEPTPYRFRNWPNEEVPFFYLDHDCVPIDYTFRADTWTELGDGLKEKVIDLTACTHGGNNMFHPFRIIGKVINNDEIKYFNIDALFATSKVPHIGYLMEIAIPYGNKFTGEDRISVDDYILHYNDGFLGILTRDALPIFKSRNKENLRGTIRSYTRYNSESYGDLSIDNSTGDLYISSELLDKILNESRGPVYSEPMNSKTWWITEMFIGRCTAEGRLLEAAEGVFALLVCERERERFDGDGISARTQRNTVGKDGRFFFKDVPDNMSCSVKGWSKESGRFYEVDPDSFKYTCEPLKKRPENKDDENDECN